MLFWRTLTDPGLTPPVLRLAKNMPDVSWHGHAGDNPAPRWTRNAIGLERKLFSRLRCYTGTKLRLHAGRDTGWYCTSSSGPRLFPSNFEKWPRTLVDNRATDLNGSMKSFGFISDGLGTTERLPQKTQKSWTHLKFHVQLNLSNLGEC